ncbi:MAG: MFS transporter [Bdellovibrionaceae bacterium]|nr:MFS transporter [Pseudobdellovibrionaceae bacterium]
MKIPAFLLAQAPSQTPLTDPAEINKVYAHWRLRTMYSLFFGYAIFYFVRKNLSAATPDLILDLGFSKTQIGLLWSLLYFAYGLSKFANGIIGDKANPRYFMAIGLILSAVTNIFFGLSSSFIVLGIFWTLNGWAQGMGWPPCARGLTHWYSKNELGTKWGIWNASHQIGGAIIMVFSGWLTMNYGWRSAFIVPAVIAIAAALFLINRLRDTPESLGLPPIEVHRNDPALSHTDTRHMSAKEMLFGIVFRSRTIWLLAIGNFFVYLVRYGVMDWAPTFLVEVKGSNIADASGKVALFELTGLFGAFAAGWASDKFFGGRRGFVNGLYMLVLISAVLIFWLNPPGNNFLDMAALSAVGFLVYGPQMLVGVAAAEAVDKSCSGTATGVTGLAGYMGSIFSGVGAGYIVDHWGWNGGWTFFSASAIIGFFCFAWIAIGEKAKLKAKKVQ